MHSVIARKVDELTKDARGESDDGSFAGMVGVEASSSGGYATHSGAHIESDSRESDSRETVGRGWVILPGREREDAVFMVSPSRLGVGPSGADGDQVWVELAAIVNLDAIGEPTEGLTRVEVLTADGPVMTAGWGDEFCAAVVDALERSAASGDAAGSPDAAGATGAHDATGAAGAAAGSAAARGGLTHTGPVLELEDVIYLGGFPGEQRKRKRCTATLSSAGVEVVGPSGLRMALAWDDVTSVQAQNSDEARFRTNTKIHRDASALVFDCGGERAVMLEARDCPTLPLRNAIETLLDGVDVDVI